MKAGGGFTLPKPSYKEMKSPNGTKISANARNLSEAKYMLKGLKRKFPSINIEQILASAQHNSSYPEGLIHHQLNFGGEISGRSIIKSALALAFYAGIQITDCQDAIHYLKLSTATPCFGYYYSEDLVSNRPLDTPLHCVAVNANPHTGLILGYLEYFGAYRIVACLGRKYDKKPIQYCYAIDPRTGADLDLSIQLNFPFEEVEAIYRYERTPKDAQEAAFSAVIGEALKRKFEAERNRVISDAVDYAFKNCGAPPGEELTEAHLKKLSNLLTERMMPYIMLSITAREPKEPGD